MCVCAHRDTHTHIEGKVGQVKQANVFQRQPAMCDVLKKQLIEQLVETLRLKFFKLWSRLKHRKDYSIKQMSPLFFHNLLKY